ncbi:ATP-binding protein [uncultured Thermanaerothrix sp.]|uniref:sensor histidine kinase n=1 Tax=uncultured Thermanaerothrix sp. TaxID=1195149 RepID=UPI00261B09E4|nr:ATP-binding protein [uncultured Thermanaerothrix sp.]
MNVTPVPLTPEILVPRLGDYLVERGWLSQEDLEAVLSYQAALRDRGQEVPLLGQLLVKLGKISQSLLDQAITEYVLQLRAALEESNQQLEQRVQQRTAELERALQKLSELNQLKANFVANISHELRTPLTHLKGYHELLLSGDLGALNESQLHALRTMQRAIERLERLIEDLILFSTTERGNLPVMIQPIDLCTLCRSLVEQVTPRARDHRLSLELSCPAEGELFAYGDWEKIGWVIHQLLDNAIKFTPAGGQIVLAVDLMSEYVEVSVTDTGIGIPANRIQELFEPFHQLDGSSTRRYGGTGLGLSLAQKIIEAHNSVISVTSELGRGSRFSFLLRRVFPQPRLGGEHADG